MTERNGSETLEARIAHEQRFMRRLAAALTLDASAADDLVQDTAVLALASASARGAASDAANDGRALRGWLARTMKRRAIGIRREEARRRERGRRAARADLVVSDEEAVNRRLDAEVMLATALKELPPKEAQAIVMRYGDDQTPTEIAVVTGEPVATVKTRLRRGLARLRELMDKRHEGSRAGWMLALGAPQLSTVAGSRLASEWSAASSTGVASGSQVSMGSHSVAAGTGGGLSLSAFAGAAVLAIACSAAVLVWWVAATSTTPGPANVETLAQGGRIDPTGLELASLTPRSSRTSSSDDRLPIVNIDLDGEVIYKSPDEPPGKGTPTRAIEMSLPSVQPTAELRLRFDTGRRLPLHGLLRLAAPSADSQRTLEYRGMNDLDQWLIFTVPAGEQLTLTPEFDLTVHEPRVIPPIPEGGRRDELITIDPLDDAAHLTLQLVGAEMPEGQRLHATWTSDQGSGLLQMPMRKVQVRNGLVDFGLVPFGSGRLRASTHLGHGRATPMYHWVINEQFTLNSGERGTMPAVVERSGAVRLRVVNQVGEDLEATFEVRVDGQETRSFGVRSQTLSRSRSRLDGTGPMMLNPQTLAPVETTITANAEGFLPGSETFVVRSDEMIDVTIVLASD